MVKIYIYTVAIGLALVFTFSNCSSCKQDSVIYNTDSIKNAAIDSIKIQQKNYYNNKIDSLNNVIEILNNSIDDLQIDIDLYEHHTDSIADELLVAQYKLERIKYYNSIATGTQLKFLRGWINRVINDK